MIWLKRRFAYADYAPFQDALQKLLLANPTRSSEFMMVSTNFADPHLKEYYVGLPDQSFASAFHDFEFVKESDLPKVIDTVHIADTGTEPFTSRFQAAKDQRNA